MVAIVTIVSVLLRTSGSDEPSQPDTVVAVDSTPPVESAPPKPEPLAPAPRPESLLELAPEPKPEPPTPNREQKLPLALSARHDHAIGRCSGTLTLTSEGFGYRSDEHEWFWSFEEVASTARRGPRSLRIETNDDKSYNFELRDALSNDDWKRYERVRSR